MVSVLKLGTLSLLYFVQGAPYGFQSACLPIILRSQGLSFTSLGALKLLFLPWVCKPLYAPLVDRTKSRKWWLQFSMFSLALICMVTSISVTETEVFQLSCLLFLLNLFSSVQDIAVDSLAVSMLDETELGLGNTVQVVAYKAGSMFAGSLLLFVREAFGWTVMFNAFASIYFITIGMISIFKISEKKKEASKKAATLKDDIMKLFRIDGTIWMIAFVLFYKLCERSEQTFMLYLVDKKVPREELAWLSTAIRAHSILGSFASGIALTKSWASPERIVTFISFFRALGIFGLTLVLFQWGIEPSLFDAPTDFYFKYLGFVAICLTSVGAGAVTTATFTMMMTLSQKAADDIQGTHYSLLATCEVLGKLLFAALAGWLIDLFGLNIVFALFSLLAFLVTPMIYYAPNSVANKQD